MRRIARRAQTPATWPWPRWKKRACCGLWSHRKPTVVFFGEAMPVVAVERAFQAARESDLMLVVGSSLVVYPAAGVPVAAVEAGAPLVIVNAEPTPLDEIA